MTSDCHGKKELCHDGQVRSDLMQAYKHRNETGTGRRRSKRHKRGEGGGGEGDKREGAGV